MSAAEIESVGSELTSSRTHPYRRLCCGGYRPRTNLSLPKITIIRIILNPFYNDTCVGLDIKLYVRVNWSRLRERIWTLRTSRPWPIISSTPYSINVISHSFPSPSRRRASINIIAPISRLSWSRAETPQPRISRTRTGISTRATCSLAKLRPRLWPSRRNGDSSLVGTNLARLRNSSSSVDYIVTYVTHIYTFCSVSGFRSGWRRSDRASIWWKRMSIKKSFEVYGRAITDQMPKDKPRHNESSQLDVEQGDSRSIN